MLVRWKFWIAALAGLFVVSVAQTAAAQCCAPPPPCCQPPPPPPPPTPNPCCTGGGHTVHVPGVNVVVQQPVIAVAGAGAVAGAQSEAGATVFFGGGSSWYVEQGQQTLINGLNVDTGEQLMQRVAYEAKRRITRKVVIQAVCIDDLRSPHPASQVRPDREVEDAYDGELYRCIAGSHLQLTIAEWRENLSLEGGELMECAKGEAIWHSSGGMLQCRPQLPARDCNERSLLRRYGAGIKILTMVREETYTAYREEASSETRTATMSIVLDGGVGPIVH
jgi:hypothetical protein